MRGLKTSQDLLAKCKGGCVASPPAAHPFESQKTGVCDKEEAAVGAVGCASERARVEGTIFVRVSALAGVCLQGAEEGAGGPGGVPAERKVLRDTAGHRDLSEGLGSGGEPAAARAAVAAGGAAQKILAGGGESGLAQLTQQEVLPLQEEAKQSHHPRQDAGGGEEGLDSQKSYN